MATLDELLAQSDPEQAGTVTPPGQPPMGMSLDDMLRQSDPELQGGRSHIRSEPITPEEEAQQRLNELIDRTPIRKKRSLVPQGVGAAAGSLAFERIASNLTQNLPPHLKYLGVPIRAGGAILGAAFGGAGGRGFQQVATGKVGEGFAGEQLESAGQEALSEVGGIAAGGLLGRALSGGIARGRQLPGMERLSRKLTEAGKRTKGVGVAAKTRLSLKKGEAGLPQGQRGQSVLTGLENFLASSMIGGGKLKRTLKLANPEALNTMKKEMIDQLWREAGGRVSKDEIAEEISQVLNKNIGDFHQRFATGILNGKKPLDPQVIENVVRGARETVVGVNKEIVTRAYTKVDDLAKASGISSQEAGDIVPLNSAFEAAQRVKDKWTPLGESPARTNMLELADIILTGPQKTFVENADKGIRAQLKSQARKLEQVGSRSKDPTLEKGIKSITDAVDQDLKVALDRFDPAVNDALLDARNAARKNIEFEKQPFVKQIHRLLDSAQPEALIKHIFKDGSPKSVELAEKALGKETVSELADTWLNQQVTESLKSGTSIGREMTKRLNKMGGPALERIFGKGKTDDLYAVAKMFNTEGAAFFEKRSVKSALNLVDSNPNLIANRVIQKDNTQSLLKWKKQLGTKRFDVVRAAWVDDALKSGNFNKTLNDLGDKMLKNTFTDPQVLRDLKDIGRLDEILGQTSEGSSVLVKILEASAIGGLIADTGKAIRGGAATIIGGFPVLGFLLTNKTSTRWIAKGVRNPRRLQEFAAKAGAALVRAERVRRIEAGNIGPQGEFHFPPF